MISIGSKLIPAVIDIVSSIAGVAAGSASIVGGGSGGSRDLNPHTSTRPVGGYSKPPDTAPSSRYGDGLRNRRFPGQIELTESKINTVYLQSAIAVEIKTNSSMDDLQRLPISSITSDRLGDIYTDLTDWADIDRMIQSDSDMQNVPLDDTPLNFEVSMIGSRRRTFFRRYLLRTGFATIPVVGIAIILGLMSQNRNVQAAIVERGSIDDCPDGIFNAVGPYSDLRGLGGVDVCNYRRIFTLLLVYGINLAHNNKPVKTVYFDYMFDAMFNDTDVRNYVYAYDKRTSRANPPSEENIYGNISANM